MMFCFYQYNLYNKIYALSSFSGFLIFEKSLIFIFGLRLNIFKCATAKRVTLIKFFFYQDFKRTNRIASTQFLFNHEINSNKLNHSNIRSLGRTR